MKIRYLVVAFSLFIFFSSFLSVKAQTQRVRAPELTGGVSWLNTDKSLSLAALKGKVVLLDFWTYGCINCIHILPDLHRLEEKYANQLVIIGVHSAKFDNEGQTENIRKIILLGCRVFCKTRPKLETVDWNKTEKISSMRLS